ncbi:MAG: methyltransferase domain-containing protein [Patescibacteria group bacterium]
MVEFNAVWYKKFIERSNEKDLLVNKISELLEGKPKGSCLEIGLGVSSYFAQKLSGLFKRYCIIEKEIFAGKIPENVELVQADWEDQEVDEKFDVIIASHVIYYFRNKKKALAKMFTSLNYDGRIIFVVNGDTADYGPLKLAFSKMLGIKYDFTYNELKRLLQGNNFREYALPSVIEFKTFDELHEVMRLSFDTHPEEYEKFKNKIVEYLKKNIKGNRFIIDQKIFEVSK